ncbi:hypothetical protein GCM10027570_49680 [Streptomonospora sediminis]
MFWKRKGKKKDGDEAGGSGTASAVTTKSTDAEDTAAGSTSADPDAAQDDTAAETAAQEQTGGTATAAGTGDGAPSADGADGSGEAEPAEAAGSEAADSRTEDAAAADTDTADTAAEDAKDSKDAEDSADGAETGADGAAAGADGDEDEDEDGDESDAEDTSAVSAAGKKRSPTAAEDPEIPGATEPDEEGVQRVRTVGVLKAEDDEVDVVSNTWIVDADDEGVIVVDPAHDAEAIMAAVGDREVYLVACTNGYNTHIAAAIEVAERDEAPIALHRRELRPWRRLHGAEHRPDLEVEGGGSLKAGDVEVDILAIPGTSTGSVAYYISEKGIVFTGDSLRAGEVGTVAGGYINYTQQLHSIGEMILTLPPDTRVLPDSGPETTVEEESANFDSWV